VIINGIQRGRAIFHDIENYLKYTMVGNFGNLFAMAVLYLVSFDLPMLPVQLLLTSLITDVPLLTIASDTVEPRETRKPERYNARSLILISAILGSCTAVFELFYFAWISRTSPGYVQTGMFLFLTFLQLIVILSIRHRASFWTSAVPSPVLAGAIFLAFAVSLALPYLPLSAHLFGFRPLPWPQLAVAVGLVALYILVLDWIKVWYYRHVEKDDPNAAAVLGRAGSPHQEEA
jgi:Mg2+-importing ATPase